MKEETEKKKKDVSLFCLTSLTRELKEKYFKRSNQSGVCIVEVARKEKERSDTLRNLVPIKEKKGHKDAR